MSYVSKYCAKKEVNTAPTSFIQVTYPHDWGWNTDGKHWGFFNKGAIPMAEIIGGILTSHPVIKALSEMAWKQIGFENKYGSMSFTLFTPFADLLCSEALARGGLDYDDLKQSYVGETIWYKRHSNHISRYTPFPNSGTNGSQGAIMSIPAKQPKGRIDISARTCDYSLLVKRCAMIGSEIKSQ
jgi:hypothetical protein